MSLPSRERGLKYMKRVNIIKVANVAPFAGAWIEMWLYISIFLLCVVAPFAGAWINMAIHLFMILGVRSRSLRGSVD